MKQITSLLSLMQAITKIKSKRLLAMLNYLLYLQHKYPEVFPSQEDIALYAKVSRETVNRAMKLFVSLGILEKDYRYHTSCIYRMNSLFFEYAENLKFMFSSLRSYLIKTAWKLLSKNSLFKANVTPEIRKITNYLNTEEKNVIAHFRGDDNDWQCPHEKYIPCPLTDIPTDVIEIFGGESLVTNLISGSSPFIYKLVEEYYPQININVESLISNLDIKFNEDEDTEIIPYQFMDDIYEEILN